MAQIAEDLLLLLLDNAANRPALDRDRREKILGAAVLLDLAWACRIRPSVDGEPIPPGRLLLLAGPALGDPILDPALFAAVQAKLASQAVERRCRIRGQPALLTGRLFDEQGRRMTPDPHQQERRPLLLLRLAGGAAKTAGGIDRPGAGARTGSGGG